MNRFPYYNPRFPFYEDQQEVTNAMYEEYIDRLMEHGQLVAETKRRHEILRKKLEEQDQNLPKRDV